MVIACGADDPVPPAVAEPPATAPTASPAEADVASLRATIAAGAVRLIDVRTPAEYAEAHVPGAVNILSELDARLGELESDRDTDLCLICAWPALRAGLRNPCRSGLLPSDQRDWWHERLEGRWVADRIRHLSQRRHRG